MKWWTIFLVQALLFSSISSEHRDQESLCAVQQTCRSCLQTSRCVWCSKSSETSSGALVRCVTREKFQREGDLWCEKDHVFDGDGDEVTMIEDRPLSFTKNTDSVQIQPQRVQLRLRRGKEYRLTLRYGQAEGYPVDLYYLMDLSYSMEKHRQQLSNLGHQLAEAMRNLTSNFRLGFGSFVDKVVLPMTSTQPEKLKVPCHFTDRRKCAPPYGYKNQMPLTENITQFKYRVQEAPVSGNLDLPEGGLDAMMQAMVCTEEIGWRPRARHLLVYSTDATFHIAGDGKVHTYIEASRFLHDGVSKKFPSYFQLAGIMEPNDCLCHLDKEGFYTYSLLQDYPSISQIDKKAREHNMNIIFVVPESQRQTYKFLSGSISGSSTGTLKRNSQNVVALIRGEYKKLVDSVTLTDNAPKMIDVKYLSRCLNETGEPMERKECGGLREGNVVEFEVVIKAVECPANPEEWRQRMEIKPRDINESLTIDMDIICDCPCENSNHSEYQRNSKECKGNGDLVCGVCVCHEGFYGKQCECEGSQVGAQNAEAISECKPNNETTETCSGRGACKCGVCDCAKRSNPQEVFYGKYCQCDNFSCKRSGGQVCGGRGKCECGTCNCMAGWGGEACDCKETNSTCMPTGENAEICTGRGDCICGSCHCHEKDNIRYSGQYCEECPTCPGQRCEELKDCVEYLAYNTGPCVKDKKCDLCTYDIDIVKLVEEDPKDQETGARICRTPGDGGCTFVFKYEYHRGGTGGDIKILNIQAQKERICPTPVNVLGVALGVVISTIVLGFLILLIWKVLTMIHDKREYVKFEKERALAKWDRGDNPLYKQATTTFSNPTFNEDAKD